MLGVCIALGISSAVIASSAMAVEMTRVMSPSPDMSMTDCAGEVTDPCGMSPDICIAGCALPTIDLPSTLAVMRHFRELRDGALLASTGAAGQAAPPDLPPPRTLYIG